MTTFGSIKKGQTLTNKYTGATVNVISVQKYGFTATVKSVYGATLPNEKTNEYSAHSVNSGAWILN